MIKKNVYRILVIAGMVVFLFIPGFSFSHAITNTREYLITRSDVSKLNSSIDASEDNISALRKKIKDNRSADSVDMEDPTAIYNFVTNLPGVSNVNAQILGINGDKYVSMGEFKPNVSMGEDKPDVSKNIDGIQIMVTVDDINKFTEDLEKQNIPFETLNVIYPEKKIIMRYNTKGGLS